jgi:branched-chain amino acid transport system substrate-binding protein
MRRYSLAPLALVAAVALVLPAGAATSKGPAAGKTVKIGIVADVTGGAGVYGTPQKNAYDMASDDIKSGLIDAGGANVVFTVMDAASDGNQVANIVQGFTKDGTALMLGPTLSGEAKKADPIAVQANLPVLGTSTTAPGITSLGSCVYRDALSEEQVIPTTVKRTLSAWHYKKAAIIYGDDNAFTKTDGDVFTAQLQKANVQIVATETFHQKDVDFQAQLTRIKDKHPDVLVIGALFPEGTKIISQAVKLGLNVKMMGGNGLNSSQMYDVAGPGSKGLVVGAAWSISSVSAGNRSFVTRYTKKYGSPPDQFAAQSYAAAQVVAALTKRGATNAQQMCDGLKSLPVADTVLGPIAFEPDRDVKSAPVILEVVKGGFTYFK